MLEVERNITINASANDVWAFAGEWGGINRIAKLVDKIETDGDSVGSIRTLTLPDGAQIKERLEKSDSMSYSYVITESPLPVSDYGATISVTDLGGGKSKLNWVGTFNANGVPDEDAKNIFIGLYEGAMAEVEKQFS